MATVVVTLRGSQVLWLLAAGFCYLSLLVFVIAWFVLLTNICSNPRTPNAATQNVHAYSCHGTIVYITPVEERLLHGLPPVGLALGIAGFGASFCFVRAYAKSKSQAAEPER